VVPLLKGGRANKNKIKSAGYIVDKTIIHENENLNGHLLHI
jgi:hypothetical protein